MCTQDKNNECCTLGAGKLIERGRRNEKAKCWEMRYAELDCAKVLQMAAAERFRASRSDDGYKHEELASYNVLSTLLKQL